MDAKKPTFYSMENRQICVGILILFIQLENMVCRYTDHIMWVVYILNNNRKNNMSHIYVKNNVAKILVANCMEKNK